MDKSLRMPKKISNEISILDIELEIHKAVEKFLTESLIFCIDPEYRDGKWSLTDFKLALIDDSVGRILIEAFEKIEKEIDS